MRMHVLAISFISVGLLYTFSAKLRCLFELGKEGNKHM